MLTAENAINKQKECEAYDAHTGGCIVWYTLPNISEEYLALVQEYITSVSDYLEFGGSCFLTSIRKFLLGCTGSQP